ncbi:MAG: hypothetical protein H7829_11400 [Magnetococcus sp. THC-1_WYH]
MTDITTVLGAGSDEFREYILRNPHTLVYSEPHFLELIAEHLGARCAWFVSHHEGAIAGLLPFLVKDGPLGSVFNSLAYYGSNGGVIQSDYNINSKAALVDAFYAMAADSKAASATIISNPLEGDAEFYDTHAAHDFRDERIGQVTHFPDCAEGLLARFEDPRPRNIRRAIKEGVVVARGATDDLEFLFSTHVVNMNAIGGIAKKLAFFDAIPAKMRPRDWAVFTASIAGKPITALLLFYFNRTVECFMPVIVASHRMTRRC